MIDSFTYSGLVEHLDGISNDVDEIVRRSGGSKYNELMEIKKSIDFHVGALKCILSIMRVDRSQEMLARLR